MLKKQKKDKSEGADESEGVDSISDKCEGVRYHGSQ